MGGSKNALDFKIKKGQNPAAVMKQRRQVFELEQQDFIQDMKAQLVNNKPLQGIPHNGPILGKLIQKKKPTRDLSPIQQKKVADLS